MIALLTRSVLNGTSRIVRSRATLHGCRAIFFSSDAENVISIDRSGLYDPRAHDHLHKKESPHKEPETEIARHIKSLIKFRGGPLTLSEYMSEVLTNPVAGYYTTRDVFGAAGDFTTSPEISQMFGEMIGIWCLATWQQLNQPSSLRIVELGPGRGTLMADLLRGTSPFQEFTSALSISLIEVSPALRKIQWQRLGCRGEWSEDSTHGVIENSGIPVSWHRSVDELEPVSINKEKTDNTQLPPHASQSQSMTTTLYIAHEFFDALPVHQFQRAGNIWKERLVDIAPPSSNSHLHMVLSPHQTPATRTILPMRLESLSLQQRASLKVLEICPQGMALAETLAKRVDAEGGAALIMDYGQDGPYDGSLAAIRQHRFVHLFDRPGTADLSAWVDFDALRAGVKKSGTDAVMYGPVTQAHFLKGLGIEYRLERLLEQAKEEELDGLIAGYRRLVEGSSVGGLRKGSGVKKKKGKESNIKDGSSCSGDGEMEYSGMGESYKAVCIAPKRAPTPVVFK